MNLPRLVFLPPIALDQTFPRSPEELDIARQTLAALNELALGGSVVIGITDTLADFVESFDATTFANPDSRDTYTLLVQMCTTPHRGVVRLRGGRDAAPHPIPSESAHDLGIVDIWAHEMGRLVVLHDECGSRDVACAGLACGAAFSGREGRGYDPADRDALRFTLVGPNEIEHLTPCKEVYIDAGAGDRIVIGVSDVYSNYEAIGGSHIEDGGDHPALHFPNGDKWPFDKKWGDFIRDKLLGQLKPMTGLDLDVIKQALKTGRRPSVRWIPCAKLMVDGE